MLELSLQNCPNAILSLSGLFPTIYMNDMINRVIGPTQKFSSNMKNRSMEIVFQKIQEWGI